MRALPDYTNFWLVWLSAAGRPQSLLSIQKTWGIRSNYLYHNEHRIGKPLFRAMADAGYLRKEATQLHARFGWIPAHVRRTFTAPGPHAAGIRAAAAAAWDRIQPFVERHRAALFGPDALAALYGQRAGSVRKTGSAIFHDLYLYVLLSNLSQLARAYNTAVLPRLAHALLAHAPDRDLLAYYGLLNRTLPADAAPQVLADEPSFAALLALSPERL